MQFIHSWFFSMFSDICVIFYAFGWQNCMPVVCVSQNISCSWTYSVISRKTTGKYASWQQGTKAEIEKSWKSYRLLNELTLAATTGVVCTSSSCCYWVHLQAVCLQSFSGSVIRWVQSLQPTLQLGLWAAVDNMWHCLAFATRAHVGCCKAPRLSTGCTVSFAGPKVVIWKCLVACG